MAINMITGKNKKGIFFTIDGIFATLLILFGLILVFSNFIEQDESTAQINYLSKDLVNSLANIKITEVDDSFVKKLISDGNITNLNNSVIVQIGEFYVLNKTELALNLSKILTEKLIPDKFGFQILVNDETILVNDSKSGRMDDLISYRRMVSGFEKFKPLRGATSRVFLEGINEKTYYSYLYFGGFVGQGNITGYIDDIPSNVDIINMYFESDSGGNFELYINEIKCNGTYYPGTGEMTADSWDITLCNSSVVPGERNNFTVMFKGDIGNSYIGGGFIRITYMTSQMQQESFFDSYRYQFPEIRGIINIYSSFYVPGILDSMNVYLHFFANTSGNSTNTLYLTIGNATVVSIENLTGENNVTLTDINLTPYISYSELTSKTVPIRIGFENVSFGYIYEGNADVALITDVSGSMDWRMSSNDGGTARNCNDPDLNLSTTSRLSVAKCLDKEFAEDIINITGNEVGLISYDTSTNTGETVYPTTDLNSLYQTIGNASPETGYSADGWTCICCGINSARDILVNDISATTLISSGSSWLYNDDYLDGDIPQDPSGNNWYDITYSNESDWSTGNAILGATNSYVYSPYVDTEITSDLLGDTSYVNLWENNGDVSGAPNDFSSGVLNSTGNTYGISGDNDGWDWDNQDGSGPFGYDDDIEYMNITVLGSEEMMTLRCNYYWGGNICTDNDCSGAYGILVNITQDMYDLILAGGIATVSFYYEWADGPGNKFEIDDQVWTKVRWTSSISGTHFLGNQLDGSHGEGDADFEIATADNPDNQYFGYYAQEITNWIESPGLYYLELGGKVLADNNDEVGRWYFDNIQIEISNAMDYYYFRKHFTIADLNSVKKGVLNVLSDDKAIIYLNGEIIDIDYEEHEAEYWNSRGKNIEGSYFRLGDNVIAAELFNSEDAAKFDMELIGLNESRDKAMMVMTDGQANLQCAEQGTGSSSQDAIQAACDAREDYGIIVYAVGYSDEAQESTLQGIADCGDGIYRKSDNLSELQDFYEDVASQIISASRHSQIIEVEGEGDIAASILYGDSYVDLDFTPITDPPEFGEISVIVEESDFDNCTFNVTIPQGIRITNAKITSYSSEHWTDELIVNGIEVYNLSFYNDDYTTLGDPFIVNIPSSILNLGDNTFSIRTGDSYENFTGCSLNNTFIYNALLKSSVSYSDVLEKAVGCTWFIEFENGGDTTVNVPPSYNGTKNCFYSAALIDYDQNDTYDDAMFRLLDNLDLDDDGQIFVDLEEQHFVIGAISVGKIPYPWGPAITEVRVWK
ncbi:VWA domain-containing protein [Candidatus Woesearchaeota archaeon]|nr:VWA domain-containing protein [Candidatus Woesearchaeota archaeon]